MATWCNCDVPPEGRLGPCYTHDHAGYVAWLTERAPRLIAAQAANDPFVDREYWPADAAEIPEFAAHRVALSEAAREWFDNDWELEATCCEWYQVAEAALKIRGAGLSLVAAHERNAARVHLAKVGRDADYPIGRHNDDFEEYTTPASVEELLAEADMLAELARRAREVEALLRRDAAEMADGASSAPVGGAVYDAGQ